MRKIVFALLCGCLFLAACKKKDKVAASVWTVNGETFSTNEYWITNDKSGFDFSAMYGETNNFIFSKNTIGSVPYIPQISCNEKEPGHMCLSIRYHMAFYRVQGKQNFSISRENGKPVFTIDSLWVYNDMNAQDSVLLKGVFKVPIE